MDWSKRLTLFFVFFALYLTTRFVNAQRDVTCNGGASCVNLRACSSLYDQLRAGNNPELTRLLRSLHCGFEGPNNPKICCPPDLLSQGAPSRAGFVNRGGQALLPNTSICGDHNEDRIVGGVTADIDEHPWMALLRYDHDKGHGFYCGGVLISSRYVMTAAHCVKGNMPADFKLTSVRLGEWDTSISVDCQEGICSPAPVDVPVEKTIAHEDYQADGQQFHDIALVRLARPVQFSEFVKPVCLPVDQNLRSGEYMGTIMEVVGWGKTEHQSFSNVKLKVRVPVVDRQQCSRVYARQGRQISDAQMCAGGDAGRDSCRGDSGGPLLSHVANRYNWYALGVVSYGPSPCGTAGWPGVYTKVGAYMDWLLNKLEP